MTDSSSRDPKERIYNVDIKACVVKDCGGELAEISYYERNNWATVEFECNKCKRRFVVKVES